MKQTPQQFADSQVAPSDLKQLLIRKPHTLKEAAERLKCSPARVEELIELLRYAGANLHKLGEEGWSIERVVPHGHSEDYILQSDERGRYRFGALGDTHLGSKYERLDALEEMYDIYESEGLTDVYHCGNWIDGEARFNKFDLHTYGMQRQLDYFVQRFPRRKGITTHYVTGDDHEGWYAKREGVDIGWMLQKTAEQAGRTDLRHLGYMEANIRLRRASAGTESILRVCHPGGGSAYATSYAPQKYIEALQGGEKPAIVLFGHWHKMSFDLIRSVWCLQVGCFDGRTKILTEHGLKQINKIKKGELVITHKNRLRPVYDTLRRAYKGIVYKIQAGQTNAKRRCLVTATEEHPFLTLEGWKKAMDLVEGEYVAIPSKVAKDGSLIPCYRTLSSKEFFKQKPNEVLTVDPHNTALEEYLKTLPPHLKVLPLTKLIPDAIAIDFDKRTITAIEMERERACPNNPRKYDVFTGLYSDVIWVCTAKKGTYNRHDYKVIDGIVYVPIRKIEEKEWDRDVYNISVVEDESYVAGNFIVHNCFKDQDVFGRKMKLQYHLGGTWVELQQDEQGAIVGCTPHFRQWFDKGYGNQRWSLSGDVKR